MFLIRKIRVPAAVDEDDAEVPDVGILENVDVFESVPTIDGVVALVRRCVHGRRRSDRLSHDERLWIDRAIMVRRRDSYGISLDVVADDEHPFDRYVEVLHHIVREFTNDVVSVSLSGDFEGVVLDLSRLGHLSDFAYDVGSIPPTRVVFREIRNVRMTLSNDRTCELVASHVHRIRIVRMSSSAVVLAPIIQNAPDMDSFEAFGFERCDAEAIISIPLYAHVSLPIRAVASDMPALRSVFDRPSNVELFLTGELDVDDPSFSEFFDALRSRVTRLDVRFYHDSTTMSVVRSGDDIDLSIDMAYYERVRTRLFSNTSVWPHITSVEMHWEAPEEPYDARLVRAYNLGGVPALREMRFRTARDWSPTTLIALPSTVESVFAGHPGFGSLPPFPRLMPERGAPHAGRAIQAFLTAVETSPARGLARLREQDPRPYLLYVMRLLTDDEYMYDVFGERWEDSIVATARSTRSTR